MKNSTENMQHRRYIPVNLFLAVDPALGIQGRDFSAFVLLAVFPDNKRYVYDAIHGYFKPDEIIQKMFEYNTRFPILQTAIEAVAYQAALKTFAMEKMARDNVWFSIQEIKPLGNRSKETRLYALQPYFDSGMLYIRPDQNELIQELYEFPKGKHDDLLDALYYANEIAFPPENRVYEETGEDDMIHYIGHEKPSYDWRAL